MANLLEQILLSPSVLPRVYPGITEERDYESLLPSFGSFNPEGNYTYTPEGQKFKESFERQSGKTLTIKPFSEKDIEESPGTYGFYKSRGPGGHTDVKNRVVYLGPEGNVPDVIAHEVGHALDPNILNRESFYSRNPKDFLTQYVKTQTPFKSEVEAQRASVPLLEEAGIPTGGVRSNPWFKGYPASFVDKGINEATEILSRPNAPRAVEPFIGSRDSFISAPGEGAVAAQVVDLTDNRTKNLLNLTLNPSYQAGVQQSLDYAKDYLNRYLGY